MNLGENCIILKIVPAYKREMQITAFLLEGKEN